MKKIVITTKTTLYVEDDEREITARRLAAKEALQREKQGTTEIVILESDGTTTKFRSKK
jgi:hypothetical protein